MKYFQILIAVCILMLSAHVFAEEVTNPVDQHLPVADLIPEEVANNDYEKVLLEFEDMKVWYPEEQDHKVKISVFPRQKLNNQEAFEFFIALIRTMPEGSYNDFRYYDGGTTLKIVVNRLGADYLHSLGTLSISPAYSRLPAQPNQ